VGTRGVGLARAQGYGHSFEEYNVWVNKESVVIAQVEHRDSIGNLEDILAVEGIDGSIIGPYDLSGSFGYPGRFDKREIRKAIERYESVCKKVKKPAGFHIVQPDPIAALRLKKKGYSFLAVGVDMLYLGNYCSETLRSIGAQSAR
jgi:2-dehydro-3-deoxyglucarate aldolase